MKTSIVYVTIKCIVEHPDDRDPEEIVNEAYYTVETKHVAYPGAGHIVETEMTEVENRGECNDDGALIEDIEDEDEQQRRDEKHGLYGQHVDDAN